MRLTENVIHSVLANWDLRSPAKVPDGANYSIDTKKTKKKLTFLLLQGADVAIKYLVLTQLYRRLYCFKHIGTKWKLKVFHVLCAHRFLNHVQPETGT